MDGHTNGPSVGSSQTTPVEFYLTIHSKPGLKPAAKLRIPLRSLRTPALLRASSWVLALGLLNGLVATVRHPDVPSVALVLEPGLTASLEAQVHQSAKLAVNGLRPNPVDFTPDELRELQRRFGVHGPQPKLAQLLTQGMDQLTPLRANTFSRIEELKPVIVSESRRLGVNPMLVAAVLFDEIQRAKPGEDLPLAADSGLFKTHGPAQLGVDEFVHQGLLSPDASQEERAAARRELLIPERNVQLLVGKFHRLSTVLGFPSNRILEASAGPRDAKALATLAYLHNGKLDYPARILSYMQDPALHALIYSERRPQFSPLI